MYYITLLAIILSSCLFADEQKIESGTLIVSYQTGPNRERLDRVRFFLTDSKQSQQMYPKKKGFVDDIARHLRRVIIEGLPIGEYELSFVLPNQDALFEEISPRKVVIEKDKITKIDQIIPVRYATVQAKVQVGSTIKQFPAITLQNENNFVCAQSFDGAMLVSQLLPGKYTLTFEPIAGYRSPQPLTVTLSPGQNAGPFIGKYTR